MSELPPLGPEQGWDARTCQRAGGTWDNLCGKPGAWHIIWDASCENAVACDSHASEALEPWHAVQIHPLGADCTMPGSVWIPEERRCVFPSDEGMATAVPEVERTTASECPVPAGSIHV